MADFRESNDEKERAAKEAMTGFITSIVLLLFAAIAIYYGGKLFFGVDLLNVVRNIK